MNISMSIGNTVPSLGNNNNRRCSPSFRSTKNDHMDFRCMRPCAVRRLPSLPDEVGESESGSHNGSQFLEDIESIMEGVTETSTIAETESEEFQSCSYIKPRLGPRRGGDDLTALMSERHQRLAAISYFHPEERPSPRRGRRATTTKTAAFGRQGLRERMDAYLEEGLTRILRERAQDTTDGKAKAAEISPSIDAIQKENADTDTNPYVFSVRMVWIIQPTIRNGKIKFKFSTEYGACIFLNKMDSLEFLGIVKEFSKKNRGPSFSWNTFYQVYTMDLRESSVVKGDAVTSLFEDMASTALKQSKTPQFDVGTGSRNKNVDGKRRNSKDRYNGNSYDDDVIVSTDSCTTEIDEKKKEETWRYSKRNYNPAKCCVRFLHRRRMKRLVRREACIAVIKDNGDSHNRSSLSGWCVAHFPFLIVRKISTRQGTAF
uniref:Uncharacterized protein n=1 Tax=Pseudo-nitzschia australis TaxID=44445 RepID=A0A6U9WJF2_9STRA